MILIPDKDDELNLYSQVLQSKNGLVKMAIHPVLFGFRVRGWLSTDHGCRIDWCGGADYTQVKTLYSILRNILLHRNEDHKAFDGLPGASNIKPFFHDEEFVKTISEQITQPLEIVEITLPQKTWFTC